MDPGWRWAGLRLQQQSKAGVLAEQRGQPWVSFSPLTLGLCSVGYLLHERSGIYRELFKRR